MEGVRRDEPPPQVLVADEEQVAVLSHVQREPVLLGEAGDHQRHARLRQPDVHLARELVSKTAGAAARRTGRQVVRPLERRPGPHRPDAR